jgi:hypothetical protein
MEDSIFTTIRKKIGRLFGREETAADQEIPEVEALEEIPEAQAPEENAGSVSLDDVLPAEPLESRWTEEYVQFLKESDGGLPQTEKAQEEAEGEEPESGSPAEDAEPVEAQPEAPEDLWCEEGETAEDLWPEEAEDLQREEADDFLPEDLEEKKE